MSTVAEVEQAILRFSPKEQEELREWLENLLEDRLEMREEFKAEIEAGKADIAGGGCAFESRECGYADCFTKIRREVSRCQPVFRNESNRRLTPWATG